MLSPRSQRAVISMLGWASATRAMACPIRPAAPIIATRITLIARVARASRVLVSASRGNRLGWRAHASEKFAAVRHRRQHARRARYPDRLAPPCSCTACKSCERRPQAFLVCRAHFAKRQANFARHQSAPGKRGLHRNRIRLDEEIFENSGEPPVDFLRGLQVAALKRAHQSSRLPPAGDSRRH